MCIPPIECSCRLTDLHCSIDLVREYLKSTHNFWQHFTSNVIGIDFTICIDICNSLSRCSDSDWATQRADRKSQGGHVFLISNGPVSWQTGKSSLMPSKTLDAKFIACSEASREAKSLLQLQKDIHSKDLSPLPINCDNQGALTFITTAIIKAQTNHIHVSYYNSRDLHRQQIVNYSYIHIDKTVTDVLTKALSQDTHTKFTKEMGLWKYWGWFKVGFKVVLLFFWKYGFSLFIWMAILRLQ